MSKMRRNSVWILAALILCGMLGIACMSHAQEGTWTKVMDMPSPRAGHAAVVVKGKIYIIGGDTPEGVLSTVEEYDPMTGTWTQKADMPTPRDLLCASAVNGKIYAIGGRDANIVETSVVEEYDIATDTWTRKADMPTTRWALSSNAVNGKIYAVGGWANSVSNLVEYDPEANTWIDKAGMQFAGNGGLSSTVVNGKIYAIGGWYGSIITPYVEEYDPITDTWTRKKNMPTTRCYLSTSVVDGIIYAIGGWRDSSVGVVPTMEAYDPATDTWTKRPDMPTSRWCLSASAVNGYIYAIGGSPSTFSYNTLPPSVISIVEAYDTGVGIRVKSFSPQEGRVTGGESMAIFGSGFPSDAEVTIGGRPLGELNVTDTIITGITPPGTEGEQDIWITAPGLDFSVLAGKFFYKPLSSIVVTNVKPDNGAQVGGGIASITGSGFLSGATVTVGGAQATGVNVTSNLITFTIPAGTEGTKDVVVTNPDGQKGILRSAYTYNPFPSIKKIEPVYGGPLAGGTDMTITGSNFMQGVTVSIGDERVTRLDFFSATELRLKTPAGKAGPKTVRVTNPDGQEAVLEDGFTYNPAPRISSVTPNAGPLEGGTEITITGTGFIWDLDVFIGGVETAWAIASSSTEITAKTPSSTAGVKDVVVVNPDGQKVTRKDAFTYNPAPVITSVTPNNGKLAGGTEIVIRGSGFLPDAGVSLTLEVNGSTLVDALSVNVVSATVITAVTPAGKPGLKDIMVMNTDNQYIRFPGGYTYNEMPEITDLSVDHGPVSGGTKVTIHGTGFLPGATVMIGKSVATSTVRDSTSIDAYVPKTPQGVWDVRVINPDSQEAVRRGGFITVAEAAYNYPNPFRASEGTTFRYVTNESVESITVKIFNVAGVPIGIVREIGSSEVKWHDTSVHVGLYVYLMEVKLEDGKEKRFRSMLEVYK